MTDNLRVTQNTTKFHVISHFPALHFEITSFMVPSFIAYVLLSFREVTLNVLASELM